MKEFTESDLIDLLNSLIASRTPALVWLCYWSCEPFSLAFFAPKTSPVSVRELPDVLWFREVPPPFRLLATFLVKSILAYLFPYRSKICAICFFELSLGVESSWDFVFETVANELKVARFVAEFFLPDSGVF